VSSLELSHTLLSGSVPGQLPAFVLSQISFFLPGTEENQLLRLLHCPMDTTIPLTSCFLLLVYFVLLLFYLGRKLSETIATPQQSEIKD
jgi:hypothetical protein